MAMVLNTFITDGRLQALYEHWVNRRRGRPMPSRADIDPIEIPAAAWPHTMLLDVVREDGALRFRYRRVGEVFWTGLGREAKGAMVDELLPETGGYREYIVGIYRELVECRRPIYTENHLTLRGDNEPMLAKRVSLPLSKDGDAVDMILGGHVFLHARLDRGDAFRIVDGLKEGLRVILDD